MYSILISCIPYSSLIKVLRDSKGMQFFTAQELLNSRFYNDRFDDKGDAYEKEAENKVNLVFRLQQTLLRCIAGTLFLTRKGDHLVTQGIVLLCKNQSRIS